MKKQLLLILFVFLFCVLLYGCEENPPIGSKFITDSTYYLKTNSFVQKELSVLSDFPLPKTIPADAEVLEYQYAYDCSLLGEPNYSVMLVLRFPDEDAYRQEQARIEKYIDSDTTEKIGSNCRKYYFGDTLTGLDILTDDRIEDGNCAILQYILLDDKEHTATYSVGKLFDGSIYDDTIVRVLEDMCMKRTGDGSLS